MYSNTISQVCATVMYKLILIFIVLIKYYYVLYFVSLFCVMTACLQFLLLLKAPSLCDLL